MGLESGSHLEEGFSYKEDSWIRQEGEKEYGARL